MVSSFIYIKTRSALKDKAFAHLSSVSSLAGHKLELYFQNLKSEILDLKDEFSNQALDFSCSISLKKINSSCPETTYLRSVPNQIFISHGKNFVFKNGDRIFFFNHKGISSFLHEREGLGKSGEIYIVGEDHLIRSASRFSNDWENIKVKNLSIDLALQGKRGVAIVSDYRQIKVVSSHLPFVFDNLRFALVSEMDWDEVIAPLNETASDLLLIGGLLIVLSLGVAFYFVRKTIWLVDRMSQEIDELNTSSAIKIIKVQEEERERIAYNLHDSVGQYVTALKWGLSSVRNEATKDKVIELSKLCESIIKEIRTISQDIMPSLIKDFGCFTAIKNYLSEQSLNYSVQINYAVAPDIQALNFKRDFELNLYRMIQELFQNAIKHSKSTIIDFNFLIENEKLVLIYTDNGVGMRDSDPTPRSLNYRTQLYKGSMLRLKVDFGLKYEMKFDLREVTHGKN